CCRLDIPALCSLEFSSSASTCGTENVALLDPFQASAFQANSSAIPRVPRQQPPARQARKRPNRAGSTQSAPDVKHKIVSAEKKSTEDWNQLAMFTLVGCDRINKLPTPPPRGERCGRCRGRP